MDSNIKFTSVNKKKKTKRTFIMNFSKKDFFAILALEVITNPPFLEFVVEIVKTILNRPFYYFDNNSFLECLKYFLSDRGNLSCTFFLILSTASVAYLTK